MAVGIADAHKGLQAGQGVRDWQRCRQTNWRAMRRLIRIQSGIQVCADMQTNCMVAEDAYSLQGELELQRRAVMQA